MDPSDLIATGVAMLVAVPLAVWSVQTSPRLLRLLRATLTARRRGFHALRPGAVMLRGRVIPIDSLVSPETQRRCVYLEYTADRWEVTSTLGPGTGHWQRAEADAEAAPFELTDGRRSVLVDPRGASFEVAGTQIRQGVQQDGSAVRYSERIIGEGQEVLVLGWAAEEGGFEPSAGYRGHNYRTVVTRGPDPQLELVVAVPDGLLARTLLGVTLRAAAMAPLVIWLGRLVY